MDWFTELFISEAKTALESRQTGSTSTESLPEAEKTGF